MREVIARIVDGSAFHEFKELYGPTLVCGYARIMGYPVGIVANNGVLFSESSPEGCAFRLAVRRTKNPPPLPAEHHRVSSWAGNMSTAASRKTGPKWSTRWPTPRCRSLTVIVGGSYGAGNYAMCGRGYSPAFLWMWPNAKIAVMGGEQAASVLLQVKLESLKAKGQAMSPEEQERFKAPILARYEDESSAYTSTSRLWDDGILDPVDTRMAIGLGISVALNAPIPDHRFGVFRM